jgi:hypothetical protein
MSDGRIFVAEITVVVDANGTEETFYFSTAPFTTSPSDTPANKPIQALLKNPGSMRYDLFSQGRLTGLVTPNYGVMSLANPYDENGKGVLDDWINYGVSNGKVTLRIGTPGDAYPSAWKTVYIARVYKIVVSEEVQITLRDRSQLLNKPVVTDVFTGSGGPEGTGAGLGRKKQMVLGDPGYIPPILINSQKQIYFVQSTGNGGILPNNLTGDAFSVFDNGIQLQPAIALYSSFEEMEANSPAEGHVRFFMGTKSSYLGNDNNFYQNGPVYMRLGSPPAGEVRVLALGYPNDDDFDNNAGTAVGSYTNELLVLRAGFELDDISVNSGAAGFAHLVEEDQTYLDVMSDKALLNQEFFGFNKADKFFSGLLSDPESDSPNYVGGTNPQPSVSRFTFTEETYADIRNTPVPGQEIPVWSITVGVGRSWPVKELAGGTTDRIRDLLSREPYYVSFVAYSDTTKVANPNAENEKIDIQGRLTFGNFFIQGFATKYFYLYGGNPRTFTIRTEMRDDLLDLDLHNVVTLQTPRFSLQNGVKTRIVGMEIDCVSRTMEFTLWIPGRGKFTGNTSPLQPGTQAYAQNQQTKALLSNIGKVKFPEFGVTARGSVSLSRPCGLDYPAFAVNYAENPTPSLTLTGSPVTARTAFNAKFTGVSSYGVEDITVGTESFNIITIGTVTTTIESVSYNRATSVVTAERMVDVRDDTAFNRFNTTPGGSKYVEVPLNCGSNIGPVEVKTLKFVFFQPISFFGFYGTDFGDFTAGNIIARLTKLDNSTTDHVITTANRSNGNLIFWGFADGQAEYKEVEIMIDPSVDVSMTDEFLGVDDIVFGPQSALIGVENCTGAGITNVRSGFPNFSVFTSATLIPPIPDPTWASKSLGSSGSTNLSRRLFAYNGSRLVLSTYEVTGPNNARIFYSDDEGETWSVTTTSTPSNTGSIAYNGTAFVIHAYGNTYLRSTDGISWSTLMLPWSDHRIITAVDNTFFVVSDTERPHRSTDDGASFSVVNTFAMGPTFSTTTGAFGTSSKMIVCGQWLGGGTGVVWISTDNGLNWTRTTTGLPWGSGNAPVSLAYSPIDDRFVAANNVVRYSTDGLSWTTVTIPGFSASNVIYGNGLFVAFSDISNDVAYSYDGISWTVRTNDLIGGAHSMISVSSTKLVAVDFGTSINSVSVGTY